MYKNVRFSQNTGSQWYRFCRRHFLADDWQPKYLENSRFPRKLHVFQVYEHQLGRKGIAAITKDTQTHNKSSSYRWNISCYKRVNFVVQTILSKRVSFIAWINPIKKVNFIVCIYLITKRKFRCLNLYYNKRVYLFFWIFPLTTE